MLTDLDIHLLHDLVLLGEGEVFNVLSVSCSLKEHLVSCHLMSLGSLTHCLMLINLLLQALSQIKLHLLGLVFMLLGHISSLLRSKVRLVVVSLHLILTPLHLLLLKDLLLDELLVTQVIDLGVVVLQLLHLGQGIDVRVELTLLSLTHHLKLLHILDMPHKSLLSDRAGLLSTTLTLVDCMVIDSKWTLRLHELWKSSVVVVTDLLPIQSVLDDLSLVALTKSSSLGPSETASCRVGS